MKISYDDTKKKQILNELDDVRNYLDATINYVSGMSIPYGFGRRSDITTTCLNALRSSKTLIAQADHWYQKTDEGFNDKTNAIKVRASKIELIKITKKALLIK